MAGQKPIPQKADERGEGRVCVRKLHAGSAVSISPVIRCYRKVWLSGTRPHRRPHLINLIRLISPIKRATLRSVTWAQKLPIAPAARRVAIFGAIFTARTALPSISLVYSCALCERLAGPRRVFPLPPAQLRVPFTRPWSRRREKTVSSAGRIFLMHFKGHLRDRHLVGK